MKRIMLDDHGQWPAGNFINLDVSSCWKPEEHGFESARQICEATHVVGHWDGDDFRIKEKEWRDSNSISVEEVIVLRVSGGAASSVEDEPNPKPWTRPLGNTECKAWILNCRNHDALGLQEAIKCFYEMTPQMAKDVFHGRLDKCPLPLQALFRPRPKPPEILPALAIICQGYLAAHAGPDGQPEECDPLDVPIVSTALAKMGWNKIDMSSNEVKQVLAEALLQEDPKARDYLRVKVANPCGELWACVRKLGGGLKEGAEQEWKSLMPQDATLHLQTEKLVDAITGTENIPPKIVAEAYIALAKALGRGVEL